jgi:hypothetical protein
MSPWVVRCELNDETLDERAITADEVWGAAEGLCRECGGDGSAVTSFRVTEVDGVYWWRCVSACLSPCVRAQLLVLPGSASLVEPPLVIEAAAARPQRSHGRRGS